MKKFLESPLGKGILDGLRVVVLSVIPVFANALAEGKIDWRVVFVVAGLAMLKVLDKFLHELGKENKDEGLTLGITRF